MNAYYSGMFRVALISIASVFLLIACDILAQSSRSYLTAPANHPLGQINDVGEFSTSLRKSATIPLQLRRAVGDLPVNGQSTTDTYEVYFHIPISLEYQVPILITVDSPELVDYRFLRISPPNVIVVARMKSAPSTTIHWEAWVLTRKNSFADRPGSAPILPAGQLPADVVPWLVATDCAQINDPFIQEQAAAVREGTNDILVLADAVASACVNIPMSFPHVPYAFDAYYALKWGNSCTGHAHAGCALFRSNGVPARSLMVMTAWFKGAFDMHWIIDYYVPDYGWVWMDTTMGYNPEWTGDDLVIMVCSPQEEFPLFLPGIEGYWHTSDPGLGPEYPNWNSAHQAFKENYTLTTPDIVQQALSLTNEVYEKYIDRWGLDLSEGMRAKVQEAYGYQTAAQNHIKDNDIPGYISALQQASATYNLVTLNPISTIYSDDFESGAAGWNHGGIKDTWSLGQPGSKPAGAHSGTHCFGTGFNGGYELSSECWLLSPVFDLTDKASATLSFWVYNWVKDGEQCVIEDPLWVEITTDGSQTFQPICSQMGGVNEDPEIPAVGGWSHLHLDLTKYIGSESAQVRFHFKSTSDVRLPGSYIDDVVVYGRAACSLDCSATTPAKGTTHQPLVFSSLGLAYHCPGAITYEWDFGDGNRGTEPNITHVYSAPGAYTWKLTVQSGSFTCTKTGILIITALPGDCDGDGIVSIGEVQKGINMFLGTLTPGCAVDCSNDGTVSIGEVQKVINAFLGQTTDC
jgi:hypothetical protein